MSGAEILIKEKYEKRLVQRFKDLRRVVAIDDAADVADAQARTGPSRLRPRRVYAGRPVGKSRQDVGRGRLGR